MFKLEKFLIAAHFIYRKRNLLTFMCKNKLNTFQYYNICVRVVDKYLNQYWSWKNFNQAYDMQKSAKVELANTDTFTFFYSCVYLKYLHNVKCKLK